MLKRTHRPESPRELRSYIMTAVGRRVSGEITLEQRFVEWLARLNPRVVSYATGTLMSAVLFGMFISAARSIPAGGPTPVEASITPIVRGSDLEFHSYNDLPADALLSSAGHSYELPRVLDNGALVSFSHIAYSKPGDEGLAAMVEVSPDGRAQLVDILGEPSDPHLVEQLWWSLGNRTFQPAYVEGRAVSTRIVLFVEKVDVGG
ncbi:MAG TPA: hypothetical protein VJH03_24795 [Blastocatellia bacterium]|nr:hypothetical protein [Blastocatellia bacterium]